MTKLSQLLILAIALFTFAACGSTDQTNNEQNTDATINMDDVRGSKEMVSFNNQSIALEKFDQIVIKKMEANNQQQDAATVANIREGLLGAKNEAQLLDLNFTMDEEPVENGVFLFSVDADEEKTLTFEMFDEEGFAMAANNTLDLTSGKNYRALNVKELDNGEYLFRLKDEEGKELTRSVVVSNQ